MKRMKFWGWGWENDGLTRDEATVVRRDFLNRFGLQSEPSDTLTPPNAEDIELRRSRIDIPPNLANFVSNDHYERLSHSYGKSFIDCARALQKEFSNPPDLIATPHSEDDIDAILDWATSANIAVIPFGGGSSVCGGMEPPKDDEGSHNATLSLDMKYFDKVVEIDEVSRAARIQGGIFGPALEKQLGLSGLTLRHFPQSFEFSTLGGWIATRGGGHYASVYTHIDDFVESTRTLTPAGVMETRRLPGSGAGPSPDRMIIGSEGAFGVITEAWLRLQNRVEHRASLPVMFETFEAGAEATRVISQSGLFPTNCRLIDKNEAAGMGAGAGDLHMLVLGFESADHPVDAWMVRALEICADHGGIFDATVLKSKTSNTDGAAGAWRNAFMRAPYMREELVMVGGLIDTFETACTWDLFARFYQSVVAATEDAIRRVTGKPGTVTCRFTHIYPDGPAPYFTFSGLSSPAKMLDDWQAVKIAASDAVIKAGGTITHHHAVGRDHKPWYDQQRPELFGQAMKAVKDQLDPAGIMNPGIIV